MKDKRTQTADEIITELTSALDPGKCSELLTEVFMAYLVREPDLSQKHKEELHDTFTLLQYFLKDAKHYIKAKG